MKNEQTFVIFTKMFDATRFEHKKNHAISTPFRSAFFEPCMISCVPKDFFQQQFDQIYQIHDTIIGSNGEEYYRLSDAKKMIEKELKKQEEKVHQDFLNQLTEELSRQADITSGAVVESGDELPPYIN